MRLQELIDGAREAAAVVTANRWSDRDVARLVNSQHRSIARKTVELDQSYHNHTFQLVASKARVQHNDMLTYRLPPWVMKVAAVYRLSGLTAQSQREIIPRISRFSSGVGWQHSANGEFRLIGYSAGIDLELEVAKLPALLTKGTLPAPSGVGTNQMRLDADNSANALNFPHEAVADAYAGSVFEITGPASVRKGQTLRCVSSAPNQGGSSLETVLTLEEAWGTVPIADDTYEMHAEIQAEHCRLLILLTARSMLAQERNLQGITALREELAEQWSLFIQHANKRDQAGPHLVLDQIPSIDSSPTIYELELL